MQPAPPTHPSATSARGAGVTGNARITGAFGAVIFVLLAVEGITVPSVRSLLSMHVYVGMLLVPFAVVKTASTMYRFARYYGGDRSYVDKGAPLLVLRWLGPVVVVTTLALLGTGIAALLAGSSGWLSRAHKATFVVWFGAMTIHVLGHILETPALALADWRRSTRAEVPRASLRLALLVVAAIAAVALAIWSRSWIGHWHADGDH